MRGIIRNNRNYNDGYPAFEIDIYLDKEKEFRVAHKKRVVYNLQVNNKNYLASIRHLKHLGTWMSPYLNDLRTGERIRLSEILIKNGFMKNENINLKYDKKSKTLFLEKTRL